MALARARSDEAFRDFFVAMGYAISRWAHVDRALFDLCKFALQATDSKTAAVFYRSPHIGDHLTLVDQLMHLSLRRSRLSDWERISATIKQLVPFRNDIVHNPAVETIELIGVWNPENKEPSPTLKKRLAERPKQWWAIRPEPTKTILRRARFVEAKREDLIAHITAVNALLSEMWALQRNLPKRPTRIPQGSPGQATSRQLGRAQKSPPNRAKPRPRPRSS
jgi:hypothetical protein